MQISLVDMHFLNPNQGFAVVNNITMTVNYEWIKLQINESPGSLMILFELFNFHLT